jgi:hypothetical protein
MSQFTAIGESSTPEMSAEGGNWFKITYLNPWDGARALRRDGDIINGDMMVAVRLVVSLSNIFHQSLEFTWC